MRQLIIKMFVSIKNNVNDSDNRGKYSTKFCERFKIGRDKLLKNMMIIQY